MWDPTLKGKRNFLGEGTWMDRCWDSNLAQHRTGACGELWLQGSCFPLQLSHPARPTKAACEVPSAEEAGLSPVETLLRVQWREHVSAQTVHLGADGLGPGHLWYE